MRPPDASSGQVLQRPKYRVRTTLMLSVLVLVGALALAALPLSLARRSNIGATLCPTVHAGQTLHYGQVSPVMATEMPAILPCVGVEINQDAVLLPLASASGILTRDQAVAKLIREGHFAPTAGYAITSAFPVDLTMISTLPPPTPAYYPGTHTPVRWASIKDRPAWVITITASTPQDVSAGGKPSTPGSPPATITPDPRGFVSHEHLALDARTGAFLIGFFTK